MQYRFKFLASRAVRKYDVSQGTTIELVLRVEDFNAEGRTNLVQSRFARLHKLTCNDIRVYDRYVMLGKQICNRALAARDAAR